MRRSQGELRARKRLRDLWQAGDLFHVFSRYPRRRGAKKVDRLAGILNNGLLAPASCKDGSVVCDLQIVVTGSSVPYDSVIFLHRFGPDSSIYTMIDPGRIVIFVDPTTPFSTPEDMGPYWAILSGDEVYVQDRIAVERLIGFAVHSADADSVLEKHRSDFERLGIPLYLVDGTAVWPTA